jgi:hypothetical protein
MEDDVEAPDGVDLDGDVDMERHGEDEEDEMEEDEKEEEVMGQNQEEDEDEDNGKEPRTIGQGEMVNTSADDSHTVVDDHYTVLPEQAREMPEHTLRPQPGAPAPRPLTVEPCPPPRTAETHTLSGLENVWLLMPQKPRPGAPTLREAEATGKNLDVDVERQLLGELAGGDSLLDVHLPDVLLHNVPLPDFSLPDVPSTEARPDGSVGEESTNPRVAEEDCVRIRVRFLPCEFPLL